MSLYLHPYADSMFICMTNYSQFCPELAITDPVATTEQLMNALILNNIDNITNGISGVVKAKHLYNQYKDRMDILELAELICLKISKGGVYLKPYAYAAKINRAYIPQRTFESYAQKQHFINLEFSTNYMLKFDGHIITYQPTFLVAIEELMFKRENNYCHNPSDSLIYEIIQPRCDELRADSREIIFKELNKFSSEYEKILNKNNTVNQQILDTHH
ncbi:MAG: hypothetical protein KBD37_00100 [Burkholderiales bacterium]|nr:hypothetical protein [Burkholderiales bacterium]